MARAVTIVLAACAIACEAFAYWGTATEAGRRTFYEMAGMIPLGSALAGALFAAGAAIGWYVDRRRRMPRRG